MKKTALAATAMTGVVLALATIHFSRTESQIQTSQSPLATAVAAEPQSPTGQKLQEDFVARHAPGVTPQKKAIVSKRKLRRPAGLSFQQKKERQANRVQAGMAGMGLQPKAPGKKTPETSLKKVAEHMSKKPHFDDPMKNRWVKTGDTRLDLGRKARIDCDYRQDPTSNCVRGQENEISVVGVVMETGTKKNNTFEKFAGEVQRGSYYEAKPVVYAD